MLYLGLTKSGQRRGAAEAITIDCCLVARLLAVWQLKTQPGDNLVPSPGRFRKTFNDMLAGLGIEDVGYKPHSLRRGGASYDYRQHGVVSRTTLRGRWNSAKTARIYITDAMAVLAAVKLPFDIDHRHALLEEALLLRLRSTA